VNPNIIDTPPSVRQVSLGRGFSWWMQSVSWLFTDFSRLGIWVTIGLAVFAITGILHLIPVVGSIVSFMLSFVLFGSLIHAASATATGQNPRFKEVFSGFGEHSGPLLGLGLLVLIISVVISAVMIGIGLGAVISTVASNTANPELTDPWTIWRNLTASWLLMAGCGVLLLPISMASWLAPALVMMRGVKPWEAMKLSLRACWRNLGAVSLYGLAFLVVLVGATVTLLIGWLFLIPMLALSTYAAYQDMFE
jgi:hypothetical protein